MPVQTAAEKQIPALYKRTALNLSMFAFVRGVRFTLHTISIADAIGMFMDSYGLDEDDLNRKSAQSTFMRMQNELLNLNRSDNEND